MGNSALVRFSRDGDQFHYLWAARRCLRLLSPLSNLVAIAIEGASTSETKNGGTTEAGEEIIDVAEYYGSEDLKKSDCIRYIQLKHSTQHSNDPWPPSGLEKTLHGFAKRYKSLEKQLGAEVLSGKLEFWFVSNRPINSNFLEVVDETANKVHTWHTEDLKKLRKFTRLNGSKLSAFCKILSLQGNHENYWEQRNILLQDTSKYLPDGDVDVTWSSFLIPLS